MHQHLLQKNKLYRGDELNVLMPEGYMAPVKVAELYDHNLKAIDSAPHPGMTFFIKAVDAAGNAGRLASEILEGEAAVRPKKTKSTTACEYCPYKGVCKFDTAFAEHRYEYI